MNELSKYIVNKDKGYKGEYKDKVTYFIGGF